jgi:hypothetical protein
MAYPAHQNFRLDYDFTAGTIVVTLAMGTKKSFGKGNISEILTFLHTVSCGDTKPPADKPLTREELQRLCEGKPITRATAPKGKPSSPAKATLSIEDLDL